MPALPLPTRLVALPLAALAVLALPAVSEQKRALDAHEHGAGALDIAIEGNQVAVAFRAPGADIVGFEYAASTDADRAAVETAIADLGRPLELFALPAEANCTLASANVVLEGSDDGDHGDDHAEDAEHDHDDDHSHEEAHDDEHADEDHAGHAAEHSEFHADYLLDCEAPDRIDRVELRYFERFPNALELDVQVVTPTGAGAFEVTRDAPVLDLAGTN